MKVRLKKEHLNTAKFEPEYGLDPMLDLALVGSGWQYRIQSRASNWQDPVEQDALSHIEVKILLSISLIHLEPRTWSCVQLFLVCEVSQ